MNSNSPIGLIELLVVLAFALGWGLLELMNLRMDKKKKMKEDEQAKLSNKIQ